MSPLHEAATNTPLFNHGDSYFPEAEEPEDRREPDPTALLVVAGVLFASGVFSLLRLVAGMPTLIVEWRETGVLLFSTSTLVYACGLIVAPFLAGGRWLGLIGALGLLSFFFFRQAMRASFYFSESRPVEVAKLETHSYVMGGTHSLLALGAVVLVVSLLIPRTFSRFRRS